jgi:septation ring formation regulator EzrA
MHARLDLGLWCVQEEAMKRLRQLRDDLLDIDAREQHLKKDLLTVESESLATGEKLDMLQSRLADATAELQMIQKNIQDTRNGQIAKGKLPGLPKPTSSREDKGAGLLKKLIGKE